MDDLGRFEEKIVVNDEIRDAIRKEISDAYDLIQIDRTLSPSETVKRIREYLDLILSSGELIQYDSDRLTNLAVTIGSLWGDAVCKEYKWTWLGLKENGDEYPAYYVVSPNNKCCIPPFGFIHKIISIENTGLDGNNDNTTMLLFNMLDGVEAQFSDKAYQLLS